MILVIPVAILIQFGDHVVPFCCTVIAGLCLGFGLLSGMAPKLAVADDVANSLGGASSAGPSAVLAVVAASSPSTRGPTVAPSRTIRLEAPKKTGNIEQDEQSINRYTCLCAVIENLTDMDSLVMLTFNFVLKKRLSLLLADQLVATVTCSPRSLRFAACRRTSRSRTSRVSVI